MNTIEFNEAIPNFLNKLQNDGLKEDALETNKWILYHFSNYCLENKIQNIENEVISKFFIDKFGFSVHEYKCRSQRTLRRPILTYIEFLQNGNYKKKLIKKSSQLYIPTQFFDVFSQAKLTWISNLNISETSKNRIIWIVSKFLIYLDDNNIGDIKKLSLTNVSNFLNQLNSIYAPESMRQIKSNLKYFLTWLYKENIISFSGESAVPIIKKENRLNIISAFSSDEVAKILNSIDTSSIEGKTMYFVVSLISFLGLRASDVRNLKFENIDWDKNVIHLKQIKTQKEIILPLIDEVKFPLLDYLKNARRNSIDQEYVLITIKAPYTKYHSTSGIYRMVSKAIKYSEIETNGKHLGPHALRHSLATNLVNLSVSMTNVSQILGHSSSKVTEVYIQRDFTHLRNLTLEVPYGL